jgi:hypothetical protein
LATRFYLPSGGSSPLASLAVGSTWEQTVSAFFRAPAVLTKTNTALTTFGAAVQGVTPTSQSVFGQWVSAPLAAAHDFTTSETASIVVRGAENTYLLNAFLAYCIRVVSGDGSTERGVLRMQGAFTSDGEWGIAAYWDTRIFSAQALAAVSAQAGDRIVIEIGHHINGVLSGTGYLRFGDPSATDDYALTRGLTTNLCPWVELSPTLTFAGSTVDDDLDGSHRVMAWAAADDLDGSHLVCGVDDLGGSHRLLTWAADDDIDGSHRVMLWAAADDLDGSHFVYGVDDLTGSHRVLAWASDDLVGSHRVLAWASEDLTGSHRLLALSDDDLAGSHRVVGVDDLSGSHKVLAFADEDLSGSHRVLAWADDDLAGSHKLILWADDDMAGSHRIRTRITSSRVLCWRILDDVAVTATTYPASTHTLIGEIELTVGGVDFTGWAEGLR